MSSVITEWYFLVIRIPYLFIDNLPVVVGRCTTTLHHRFRAVYPCLDKIFWKLLKLNTSPSKPLKYSVKVSEFKETMASHATFFDGEPSRLK